MVVRFGGSDVAEEVDIILVCLEEVEGKGETGFGGFDGG